MLTKTACGESTTSSFQFLGVKAITFDEKGFAAKAILAAANRRANKKKENFDAMEKSTDRKE